MANIRYFQTSETVPKDCFDFTKTVKGVCIAFLSLFALLAVFALAVTYVDIPTEWIFPAAGIVFYACAFLAGVVASLGRKSHGWLTGICAGAFYGALTVLISCLIRQSAPLVFPTGVKLISCALLGCIGGIFGINFKHKKKKR